MKVILINIFLLIITTCLNAQDDVYFDSKDDEVKAESKETSLNEILEHHFPMKNGRIFYQNVIQTEENQSADELYIKAKKWISSVSKSSDAVIDVEDKDAHLIIVEALIFKGHNPGLVNPVKRYTLMIETKNSRFRYTLSDIIYEFTTPDLFGEGLGVKKISKPFEIWLTKPRKKRSKRKEKKLFKFYNEYCEEVNETFESLLTSLESAMMMTETSEW